MNIHKIRSILEEVYVPGYKFEVVEETNGEIYMQAQHAGLFWKTPKAWKTRKWKLSEYMTKSEIVQTAMKCLLTSVEHEAREAFSYKGVIIFGPHFDVDQLVLLCQKPDHLDVRP